MSRCPYCNCADETEVTTSSRARPSTHTLVQCDDTACQGYFVRHANGRAFPLADRTDDEADAVQRVIDG